MRSALEYAAAREPNPPALETAATSSGVDGPPPIGASTTGMLSPYLRQKSFMHLGPLRSGSRSANPFELLVNLHLKSRDQPVVGIRQPNHRQHFVKHGLGHTFLARRCSVRGDAIIALVTHAHRNVQQLLHQGIQRALRHDAFCVFPYTP